MQKRWFIVELGRAIQPMACKLLITQVGITRATAGVLVRTMIEQGTPIPLPGDLRPEVRRDLIEAGLVLAEVRAA